MFYINWNIFITIVGQTPLDTRKIFMYCPLLIDIITQTFLKVLKRVYSIYVDKIIENYLRRPVP